MAYVRQLKSKRWAATVYTPDGRKTKTFDLKGSADAWARDLERDIERQDYINPNAGKDTVAECWQEFEPTRRVAKATRMRSASAWNVHVEPRWAQTQVRGVLKPNVEAWITKLEKAGVGGHSIVAAVGVLRAILDYAVDTRRIRANPVRGARMPMIPAHIDRVFEPDEEDRLIARLDELFPGRPDAGLFVKTMFETGGRWEEVAAILPDNVLSRRRRIRILPVMERDGTVRPYPKNAKPGELIEAREVPVTDDLIAELDLLKAKAVPGEPLFRTPAGGYVTYSNWLYRIWHRAMKIPAFDEHGNRLRGPKKNPHSPHKGVPLWVPLLDDPQPTPHDIRHTYGTRLADGGVDLHDIMKLMGHRLMKSSMRYIHSGEKRFDRARDALRRAREG